MIAEYEGETALILFDWNIVLNILTSREMSDIKQRFSKKVNKLKVNKQSNSSKYFNSISHTHTSAFLLSTKTLYSTSHQKI